ncbi:uncharacterized protein KRP23_8716 [Phytophthora ramorum]|uniref:uncharacterized protein n=1 Tax=Phytophthora ramorum TaxID=164328 RepID=UPI0030A4B538|nr:hypothetical protein KRP23_8716 [Phytophthora ramorum]
MDSHSSTHSKSAAIRSPLTSSLDEQGSTPSASSSYFIEGPWEQRNRRFQNVLLHVCSFILILEFAERVSYYGINQGLKNFMGKLGWSQDSALTKLCTIVKGNCAFSYEARMLYYGLVAFGAAFPLNLLASFLSDWLSVGQYLSYFVVLCCAFGMYAWIRYGMNTAYMDKSKASNGGKFNDETVDEIKMVIRVLPFASFMIMWECAYDAECGQLFQSAFILASCYKKPRWTRTALYAVLLNCRLCQGDQEGTEDRGHRKSSDQPAVEKMWPEPSACSK